MATLANQCPAGNTQEQITLVIHGPTWINRMSYDAHAMMVVLPMLLKSGWSVEASGKLPVINVICPMLQDAKQEVRS